MKHRGIIVAWTLQGLCALWATGALAAGGSVDPGQALAAQRQCLGCHQVDARRVGPPFRAIARRFQGRPEAVDHISQVIRQGSSGQWGAIPMPAQTRLSAQDARRLALWILSLQDPAQAPGQ
jgi:cytochrome c